MRHTNQSSIFGMTITGIVQILYSSRHAVNQGCQDLERQRLSCINDCLSQFCKISRLVGTWIHGACYFGPHVLYRIHIRRPCWPFHVFDPFSFLEIDHFASSLRSDVVILVHKIMPKCQTNKWQYFSAEMVSSPIHTRLSMSLQQ